MKLASVISRYLLGIIFLNFGINGFLHFIPTPPSSAVGMQSVAALARRCAGNARCESPRRRVIKDAELVLVDAASTAPHNSRK